MFNMWGRKPQAGSDAAASSPAPSANHAQQGGALFSGMSVRAGGGDAAPARPASNVSTPGGSAFSFIASASTPTAQPSATAGSTPSSVPYTTADTGNAPAPTSGFSFITGGSSETVSETSSPATSNLGTTGFSFLNTSANAPPAPSPAVETRSPAPSSGFSFLSASSPAGASKPQPLTTSTDTHSKSVADNEGMNKRSLSSRASSESLTQPQTATSAPSAPGPLSFLSNQPVRKKKISSKRPGYARAGGVEDYEENPQPSPQPQTIVVDSSSSILAGLTVYVDPTGEVNESSGAHVVQEDIQREQIPPVSGTDSTERQQHDLQSSPPVPTKALTPEPLHQESPSGAASVQDEAPETSPSVSPRADKKQTQRFVESSARLASELKKIEEEYTKILERETQIREVKQNLAEKIDKATEEQNGAMEKEDFEKAEQLQGIIDASRRELAMVEEELVKIAKEESSIDYKREEILSRQLAEVELQVDEADAEARTNAAKASAASQSLQAERSIIRRRHEEKEAALAKRIEEAKAELVVADEEMAESKKRVDAATSDIREELEAWETKIKVVDDEIAELERQLAAKREERAELSKHHEETEAKMQSVAGKYTARVEESQKKYSQCEEQMEKLAKEQANLETLKAEGEGKIASEEARVGGLEAAAQISKKKLTVLEVVLDRLKQDAAARKKRAADTQREAKQLQALNDDYTWKKGRVEQLESELTALEAQAAEDARLLIDSAKELPELEQQKQMWVSMRNFKEAGRVASEIKSLQQKRVDSQKRLDDSKIDMEEKRTSLTTLQGELITTGAELEAVSTRLENEKLRGLRFLSEQLRRTMDEFEKDAAEDVSLVGLLDMLRAEQKSLETRAAIIAKKIGSKVDLSEPPAEEVEQAPSQSEGEMIEPEAQPDPEEKIATAGEDEEEHDLPLAELEALLEKAVHDEDFELADELASRIEKQKEREVTKVASNDTSEKSSDESLPLASEPEVNSEQNLEPSDGLEVNENTVDDKADDNNEDHQILETDGSQAVVESFDAEEDQSQGDREQGLDESNGITLDEQAEVPEEIDVANQNGVKYLAEEDNDEEHEDNVQANLDQNQDLPASDLDERT